jgi:hypothetical protein
MAHLGSCKACVFSQSKTAASRSFFSHTMARQGAPSRRQAGRNRDATSCSLTLRLASVVLVLLALDNAAGFAASPGAQPCAPGQTYRARPSLHQQCQHRPHMQAPGGGGGPPERLRNLFQRVRRAAINLRAPTKDGSNEQPRTQPPPSLKKAPGRGTRPTDDDIFVELGGGPNWQPSLPPPPPPQKLLGECSIYELMPNLASTRDLVIFTHE